MESRALANPQKVSRIPSASPAQKRGFRSLIRLLGQKEDSFSALDKALRTPAEDISGAKKELKLLLGNGKLKELLEQRDSLPQAQADKLFISAVELFIDSGRSSGGWIARKDSDIQNAAAELASFLAIGGRGVSEAAMGMVEGNEKAMMEAAKPTGNVEACANLFAAIACALHDKNQEDAAEGLLDRLENAAGVQGENGREIFLRVQVHYGTYGSLSSLLVPNKGRPQVGGEFAEAGI